MGLCVYGGNILTLHLTRLYSLFIEEMLPRKCLWNGRTVQVSQKSIKGVYMKWIDQQSAEKWKCHNWRKKIIKIFGTGTRICYYILFISVSFPFFGIFPVHPIHFHICDTWSVHPFHRNFLYIYYLYRTEWTPSYYSSFGFQYLVKIKAFHSFFSLGALTVNIENIYKLFQSGKIIILWINLNKKEFISFPFVALIWWLYYLTDPMLPGQF